MSTAGAIFLVLVLGVFLFVVVQLRLQRMRELIEALTERVAALERMKREPVPPPVPDKVTIPPSPLLERTARPPVPPPLPPPLPTAPPSPSPVGTPFNWEAFMGLKMFAWLGGLALFLGVVFLVKYSFENNLITPLGRITIGLTIYSGLGYLWQHRELLREI